MQTSVTEVLGVAEGVLRGRTNVSELMRPLKEVFYTAAEVLRAGSVPSAEEAQSMLPAAIALHNKARTVGNSAEMALPQAYMKCTASVLIFVYGEQHAAGHALALKLLVNAALSMVSAFVLESDNTATTTATATATAMNVETSAGAVAVTEERRRHPAFVCFGAVRRAWTSADLRGALESLNEAEWTEVGQCVYKSCLAESELVAACHGTAWKDVFVVLQVAIDLHQSSRPATEVLDLVHCLLRVGAELESKGSVDVEYIHSFELALKLLSGCTSERSSSIAPLMHKAHLAMAYSHIRAGDFSQARAHIGAMGTGSEAGFNVLHAKLTAQCEMGRSEDALSTLMDCFHATDDHCYLIDAMHAYERRFLSDSGSDGAETYNSVRDLYVHLLGKFPSGVAHQSCALAFLRSHLGHLSHSACSSSTDLGVPDVCHQMLNDYIHTASVKTDALTSDSFVTLVSIAVGAVRMCRSEQAWRHVQQWVDFLHDLLTTVGPDYPCAPFPGSDSSSNNDDHTTNWAVLRQTVAVWKAEYCNQLGLWTEAREHCLALLQNKFDAAATVMLFKSAIHTIEPQAAIDMLLGIFDDYQERGGSLADCLTVLLACRSSSVMEGCINAGELSRLLLFSWLTLYEGGTMWKQALSLTPNTDSGSGGTVVVRPSSATPVGVFALCIKECSAVLKAPFNKDVTIAVLRDLLTATELFETMVRECLGVGVAGCNGREKVHLIFGTAEAFHWLGQVLTGAAVDSPLIVGTLQKGYQPVAADDGTCLPTTSDQRVGTLSAAQLLERAEFFLWCGTTAPKDPGTSAAASVWHRIGCLILASSLRTFVVKGGPVSSLELSNAQKGLQDCNTALELLEGELGHGKVQPSTAADTAIATDTATDTAIETTDTDTATMKIFFDPSLGGSPLAIVCTRAVEGILRFTAPGDTEVLDAFFERHTQLLASLAGPELLIIATLLREERGTLHARVLQVVDMALKACHRDDPFDVALVGQLHRLALSVTPTQAAALACVESFLQSLLALPQLQRPRLGQIDKDDMSAIFAITYNKALGKGMLSHSTTTTTTTTNITMSTTTTVCGELGDYTQAKNFLTVADRLLPYTPGCSHEASSSVAEMLSQANDRLAQ